ncbi:class I SAM-dependent methyltransferase [Nocardia altamirensis]|uniref:class I SAM-dependent methyltransferase n=1 Tax=Nocardia altamirensis TaxID=472158 RepID=UPI0014354FF7|nr:class I SAM-dependent methyltransferase [Nocardia altamirensis]
MVEQPVEGDAFGAMLLEQWEIGDVWEVVERDDGHVMVGWAAERYFAEPSRWNPLDTAAIDRCVGSVLDVGAGAGRACLELQRRELPALALDTSAKALQVCGRRGVRDSFLGTVFDLARQLPDRRFDSILLLGNNFGLLESPDAARRFLDALARLCTDGGRVIGRGLDPYSTEDPDHLRYHDRNRAVGRRAGQMRLRVRHRSEATPWFAYWMMSPHELEQALAGTTWDMDELHQDGGSYMAVLGKN